MVDNTLLKVTALSKSFPGVQALKDINFNLKKGEVHALIGENGAGKSTFLKILSGNIQPDKGTINFEGKNIIIKNTKMARDIGIGMTYQELSLVPQLSIAENIFLGGYFYKNKLLPFIDWNMIYNKAEEEFDKYRLDIDVRKKANKVGVGQQQLVEIIRTVLKAAKILLLDEYELPEFIILYYYPVSGVNSRIQSGYFNCSVYIFLFTNLRQVYTAVFFF